MTEAQFQVFNILRNRQLRGLTSTSTDIAKKWGNKDRSYTYRVLRILIDNGLIENYARNYYKVAE